MQHTRVHLWDPLVWLLLQVSKMLMWKPNIRSILGWNSSRGGSVALTDAKPGSILMSFNRWLNLRKASRSLTHLYPAPPPPPCKPPLFPCGLNACRGFGEEGGGGEPEEMGRSADWQRWKNIFPELICRRGKELNGVWLCVLQSFLCLDMKPSPRTISPSNRLIDRCQSLVSFTVSLCHSYLSV